MKATCDSKASSGKNYVPPPVGNGDISAQIDMNGVQRQKSYFGMTPCIVRAGRRYNTRLRELIPFGFVDQLGGEPVEWTQTLDAGNGIVSSECAYADGSAVGSETFAHLELPVLAFRKRFKGPYSFSYTLAESGHERKFPKGMITTSHPFLNGVDIAYSIDGLHGVISFFCDKAASLSIGGNKFTLTVDDGAASFFLTFSDSMDGDDVNAGAERLKELVRKQGFDGLFSTHCDAWTEFWSEGYVRLQDSKAQSVYESSLYHLRISATKWSIPVGIFPSHWQGRYFGFDEHFSQMGLLTSGHLDIARRVPEFRHKILGKANSRVFSYFGQSNADTGTRYHWESDENGDDCTPPGFWLEHIFNMACVALGAWHQYLYSGDMEFLSGKGYELIMRCADFYMSQCLYEAPGDRLIVGKCTDMERLGPARENAFMTTCGVIATLEAAGKASLILTRDEAKAARWNAAAKRLRKSLPAKDGRYIPYPECQAKSIAVFAGSFPYQCLDAADPKQLAAIEDFLVSEAEYGNMYPVGNSVCTWYAGWKGVAFARLGLLDKARECIAQAAGEAQCFSEIFEIASPVNHPWFTTAEGTYVQMVNETMIQSKTGVIEIFEQLGDCEWRLPAIGGIVVEAAFRDSTLKSLTLTAKHAYSGRVVLADERTIDVVLAPGESKKIFDDSSGCVKVA